MNDNIAKRIKIADTFFLMCIVIIAVVLLVFLAYPILYVIVSSISTTSMSKGLGLFTQEITMEGYKTLLYDVTVMKGFKNSVIYTTFGCLFSTILTVLCAYPLSRKDFFLGKYISIFFIFTMYFNGGMIPTYLLVKNLGLINSMWSLILPSAISMYNMMLLTSSLSKCITPELLDAAKLDRCGEWKFLIWVVIPMVMPSLLVIALFYIVSYWNSYFEAMLYISDRNKLPLANVLRNILILNQNVLNEWNSGLDLKSGISLVERARLLEYALIVVASLPMIIISFFTNRYAESEKFKN